jgi:hypothetical protein
LRGVLLESVGQPLLRFLGINHPEKSAARMPRKEPEMKALLSSGTASSLRDSVERVPPALIYRELPRHDP